MGIEIGGWRSLFGRSNDQQGCDLVLVGGEVVGLAHVVHLAHGLRRPLRPVVLYDISTFVVIYDNVGGRVLTIRRYGQTDERSSLVTRCGIPDPARLPAGPGPAARPRRGSEGSMDRVPRRYYFRNPNGEFGPKADSYENPLLMVHPCLALRVV